jgi:hypothetical protein
MGGKRTEACGRCGISSVVDATAVDAEEEGRPRRDLFGDARIEVDEDSVRKVSPAAWLGGVVSKIDQVATRLTYGR